MHKCLKCGRIAQSISEISQGCTCGSKVFVFTRLSDGEPTSAPSSSITLIPNLSRESADIVHPSSDPASPASSLSSSDSASVEALSGPSPSALTGVPADSASRPVPETTPVSDAAAPDRPVIVEEVVSSPQPSVSSPQPSVSASHILSEAILSSEPVEEEPALRHLPPTVASTPISDPEEELPDSSKPYSEVWLSKGGSIKPLEQGAPIQSASDSVSAFTDPDVANVRQLKSGIYEIDVGRLKGEPLVIQDSEGVYYVRLPFVPLGESAPGERTSKDQ